MSVSLEHSKEAHLSNLNLEKLKFMENLRRLG